MAKPNAPRIPSNVMRDVHEHEVFLSFTDDADAEQFHEWWQSVGLEAWQDWCADGEKKSRGDLTPGANSRR